MQYRNSLSVFTEGRKREFSLKNMIENRNYHALNEADANPEDRP